MHIAKEHIILLLKPILHGKRNENDPRFIMMILGEQMEEKGLDKLLMKFFFCCKYG
jgi:hypothetical protein